MALKSARVAGKRGRPDCPIQLGVGCAVIQGQAERIHVRLVEGNLRIGNLGGEQVEVENVVPDEVVFLAPGACLVEGQAIVVAVSGHRRPLGGHGFGGGLILRCCLVVAQFLRQLGIGAKGLDRLDG